MSLAMGDMGERVVLNSQISFHAYPYVSKEVEGLSKIMPDRKIIFLLSKHVMYILLVYVLLCIVPHILCSCPHIVHVRLRHFPSFLSHCFNFLSVLSPYYSQKVLISSF